MSKNKINQPSGAGKENKTRPGNSRKAINPDKLLSDINQQTEALNKIIKKFGEIKQEKDRTETSGNKSKFRNK
jgi:hypothetical protein